MLISNGKSLRDCVLQHANTQEEKGRKETGKWRKKIPPMIFAQQIGRMGEA